MFDLSDRIKYTINRYICMGVSKLNLLLKCIQDVKYLNNARQTQKFNNTLKKWLNLCWDKSCEDNKIHRTANREKNMRFSKEVTNLVQIYSSFSLIFCG